MGLGVRGLDRFVRLAHRADLAGGPVWATVRAVRTPTGARSKSLMHECSRLRGQGLAENASRTCIGGPWSGPMARLQGGERIHPDRSALIPETISAATSELYFLTLLRVTESSTNETMTGMNVQQNAM